MASSILFLNPTLTTPHKSLTTTCNIIITNTSKSPATTSLLPTKWREIQGSNNWETLINPLHPSLQSEIIRYGGLTTACYDVFDLDPTSSRYLNCKYGKQSMFDSIGMKSSGYDVTKYVYATPDIAIPMQPRSTSGARWIGYVAVSSTEHGTFLGRREILVCFRGTVTKEEWIANMMSSLTPARLDPNNPRCYVRVEAGFLNVYTCDDSMCRFDNGSCREQLLSEISRLINMYKGEEMSITLVGHSMGSSLALLLGYDLAELGLNRDVPITVYSFGGPRVGNLGFKKRCEELGVKVLRVVNVNDPVTKMPGVLLNDENVRCLGALRNCDCYAHVGVELALDFFNMRNPSCVHDLETYIELIRHAKVVQVKKKGVDVVKKARELMRRSTRFDAWQWKHAAIQVGDLVQTLGF